MQLFHDLQLVWPLVKLNFRCCRGTTMEAVCQRCNILMDLEDVFTSFPQGSNY